jgi:hypothetical protein
MPSGSISASVRLAGGFRGNPQRCGEIVKGVDALRHYAWAADRYDSHAGKMPLFHELPPPKDLSGMPPAGDFECAAFCQHILCV